MKKFFLSERLNSGQVSNQTQLIQAKVDKELFNKFRKLKHIVDRSYRSMFEHFMRSELDNVETSDRLRRHIND